MQKSSFGSINNNNPEIRNNLKNRQVPIIKENKKISHGTDDVRGFRSNSYGKAIESEEKEGQSEGGYRKIEIKILATKHRQDQEDLANNNVLPLKPTNDLATDDHDLVQTSSSDQDKSSSHDSCLNNGVGGKVEEEIGETDGFNEICSSVTDSVDNLKIEDTPEDLDALPAYKELEVSPKGERVSWDQETVISSEATKERLSPEQFSKGPTGELNGVTASLEGTSVTADVPEESLTAAGRATNSFFSKKYRFAMSIKSMNPL